ncbi:MAG: hypothetical protein FDZ75_00360 [Actinobacteria bacterium]|nr:MAG: hypothetical protein FDZ75_00360 [Actinomycetota bacterium]
MNDVVVGLLSSAIGFAISPISLIELILVVFSRRARVNGAVFLFTLAVPLFAIPLLGATVVKSVASGSQTQGMNPWLQVTFGVLLLMMAVVNLRNYRSTDAPKVFETIQGMGPGAVFALALSVTLFNPKNLALLISAGNTMREASMSTGAIILACALFTVVAMAPFLAVVGYQLLGGEAAEKRLIVMKEALLRNNHKIMFWVTGVLGIVFVARALPVLLG